MSCRVVSAFLACHACRVMRVKRVKRVEPMRVKRVVSCVWRGSSIQSMRAMRVMRVGLRACHACRVSCVSCRLHFLCVSCRFVSGTCVPCVSCRASGILVICVLLPVLACPVGRNETVEVVTLGGCPARNGRKRAVGPDRHLPAPGQESSTFPGKASTFAHGPCVFAWFPGNVMT